MPRKLMALLVLGAAARCLAAEAEPPASPPSRAKPQAMALGTRPGCLDVKLPCTDGKVRCIGDVKGGKGTLILFTCNHCPYVKAWQDRIVKACNDAAARGIGVLAVDANDPAMVPGDALCAMKELAATKGYRFPYASDAKAELARAFGASHTPEAFLLDAKGALVYHGTVDDSAQDPAAVTQHWLADALDAVANGKEVPVKETKAIGCAIKYAAE